MPIYLRCLKPDLCWEEFTHGVVGDEDSYRVDPFGRA